jgi:hypothetical protein
MKMNRPVVREFVAFLKHQLAVPPWAMQEQLTAPAAAARVASGHGQ